MSELTDKEKALPEDARLALEAVLIFHSGSPWDMDKQLRWNTITTQVLGHCTNRSAYGLSVDHWEATTRTLCRMVRKSLGRPEPEP